jgi:hypothetical protein
VHGTTLPAGDVTGDGLADLIVAGTEDGSVRVYLSQGSGRFVLHNLFPANGVASAIALLDLNMDGFKDLAITDYLDALRGHSTLNLFLNDGTGRFLPEPIIQPTWGGMAPLAVGDFNGDGRDDLALGYYGWYNSPYFQSGGVVSIFFNQGDGGLQWQKDYDLDDGSVSALAIADMNGDGSPDVLALDVYLRRAYVMLNDGDGGFEQLPFFPVPTGSGSFVVTDFNGDLRPDIVVLNSSPNTLNWMWGKCW